MTPTTKETPVAHTPIPWKVGSSNEVYPDGEGGESFSEWLEIVGENGHVVCELPGHSNHARGNKSCLIEDANAAFLIEAANNYKRLREANAELLAGLREAKREVAGLRHLARHQLTDTQFRESAEREEQWLALLAKHGKEPAL